MTKLKRKICVVTGTRAEYGLLKPVMEAIKKSKNLNLQVLVTGTHLVPKFGETIKEIKKDGFTISEKAVMTTKKDSPEAMAESIGKGIVGMVKVFKKIKPDIVLVLGDRIEALAASIAAVYMQIAVAHIHGGDSPQAGLDEYTRHAITKISHIHFPATKKSAERIIKMGEDKKRVFIVGAPALGTILKEKLISLQEIAKKYHLILKKPILLVVQHPVTTEVEDAARQIKETLEALKEEKYQTIIIYPNADAGGRKIITIIEKYRKYPFFKIYKSLAHRDYLSLMKISSVMIGNSSSGIIESPSFKLPVINIGPRQCGRERADNIIDVDYKKEDIKKAIEKALYNKKFKDKVRKCKSPYDGEGKAGLRIAKILSTIRIDKKLFQKKLTY